jgi:hypothetical protein
MKKLMILLLSLLMALCFVPSSIHAMPITFIHQGSGSGTLDGAAFGQSAFTITAFGDTDNVETYSSGFFIDHISASIDIDGLGIFNIFTATRTFVNNLQSIVGFSRAGINGADLFNGPNNALFNTWDMLSSIGPILGSASLLQWINNPQILTDGGILFFNNGVSDALFEATVVPIPASILLLGSGLVGLLGVRKKKILKKKA